MQTGEAAAPRLSLAGAANESGAQPMRISVGGGDDAVTRIQLAARWAEVYAPAEGDSLQAALQRFKTAFEYLDSVTHGIEPHVD